MDKFKQSLGGLKNAVTNVIDFMVGNNDELYDDSLSSAEVIDCESDCSNCNSDIRPISLASSNSSKHASYGRVLQDLTNDQFPKCDSLINIS